MTDLIERLEKATGPDRELDVAIWAAITPAHLYRRVPPGLHYSTWQINRGTALNPVWDDYYPHLNAKPYTESIDAALMLVPEGWFGSVQINRNVDTWLRENNDSPIIYGRGSTPVISLCIAALKARRDVLSAHTGEGEV